jgi:membrane protein implicated in regulation of membrane protease activity
MAESFFMTIGIIGVAILVALVVLFLVWRTVKVFIKLALVGFVALLVVAALVWWNWTGATSPTPSRNRPANTRRATNR